MFIFGLTANNEPSMKFLLPTLLILTFAFKTDAQEQYNNLKEFSKTALLEDFSYMKNILAEGHPGLNWYSSKSDFSKVYAQIENSLKDSMNELEFPE